MTKYIFMYLSPLKIWLFPLSLKKLTQLHIQEQVQHLEYCNENWVRKVKIDVGLVGEKLQLVILSFNLWRMVFGFSPFTWTMNFDTWVKLLDLVITILKLHVASPIAWGTDRWGICLENIQTYLECYNLVVLISMVSLLPNIFAKVRCSRSCSTCSC